MKISIAALLMVSVLLGCKKTVHANDPVTPGDITYTISTNKAVYQPGESVTFTLNQLPTGTYVRYRFLNETLKEEMVSNASWTWQPPSSDFKGYIVELFTRSNNTEKAIASIAVDVSSNWSKFPRYGFLSHYDPLSEQQMDAVINNLKRHHINGIQYYDWLYEHHQPLAGTIANPSESWKNIGNQDCRKATVQGYIARAKAAGMKSMFYNLCFGTYANAETDGVKPEWYMFKDVNHKQKDGFILPKPPFISDLYFTNPGNAAWQQYIAKANDDVYKVYDFDGYHVDQVGERGVLYNYDGSQADLTDGYRSFVEAMKKAHPAKRLVMNAVNQYGQQDNIATTPVDFMYTEVWTGNEGYKDLATIISNNSTYSGGKSTVLAAYLDYNKAERPGTFNNAGVLLANAVIFAFGGSHIELGEHMLGKEYFPNNNLQMNEELKAAMISYYDFLTGYQNLLRDGGVFNKPTIACTNGRMNIGAWPPQSGKIATQGKQIGNKQVIHLVNFANANSFDWRDTDGNQPVPATITDATIEVVVAKPVTKLWYASPDINGGVPTTIVFTQTGDKIRFVLPHLKYWDMLVIE